MFTKLSKLALLALSAIAILTLLEAPLWRLMADLILANDLPGPAPLAVLALGWTLLLKRRQPRSCISYFISLESWRCTTAPCFERQVRAAYLNPPQTRSGAAKTPPLQM